MQRYLLVILGFLFILPQLACAGIKPSSSGGISIQLEDENGRPLNTYQHRGATYVLGNMGHRYNLRVSNGTHQRVETVITVDGRNVISGAVGDYRQQRGYVVDPYDSVLVEGFRQSMRNVASFRFTTPGDSYSARRGTPQHVGVIGVAVFAEKRRGRAHIPSVPPSPLRGPSYGSLDSSSGGSAFSKGSLDSTMGEGRHGSGLRAGRTSRKHRPAHRKSRQRLGTRYGESRHSEAVSVTFERQNSRRPAHVLAVYYDDHSGLASRGIKLVSPRHIEPNPFPHHGFAPPP